MAGKRSRSRKSKNKWTIDKRWSAITALVVAMLSIFVLIALTSYLYTWKDDQDKVIEFGWELLLAKEITVQNWLGRFGAIVSFVTFYKGIGVASLFLPVFGLGTAIIIFFKRHWMHFVRLATYLCIAILVFPLTFEYLLHASPFAWGGALGFGLYQYFSTMIGAVGLGIMLLCVFVGLIYWHKEYLPQLQSTFRVRWSVLRKTQKKFTDTFLSGEALQGTDKTIHVAETAVQPSTRHRSGEPEWAESSHENGKVLEEAIELDTSSISKTKERQKAQADKSEATGTGIQLEMDEKSFAPGYPDEPSEPVVRESTLEEDNLLTVERDDKTNLLEPYDPTKELSQYSNPVLDLLDNYMIDALHINRRELESNKDQIITTLQNYKIEITKIRATIGPTVTLYEIIPAPGVRISRIKNLEDDIALSLAALGIRIIAPIPGKGTIGIEVPNKKKQIVSLKETLASDKFNDARMELPIGLGKTISNEVFVADLAKMPHLLIAGATGQGKSVGINTIIMSLLYRKHPSQVKLILIDPKKVELFPYSKLEKHFLAFLPDQEEPIITDTKKVVHTLNSLCIEMDERYNLLKKAHARNIKEYNKKFIDRKLNPLNGHKYLPFIVLVIDEFADLIMTAGKEVELPIARLAQLARAVGIHLIIATQRPSVNIITGVIKANFPARIAFKVTSKVDSRTILDSGGADQLIGRGDMLLSVGSDIVRLQCAFIDTPEVERVIDFISDQRGFSEPYYLPEYNDPNEDDGDALGEIKVSDLDELFTDAGRLVVLNNSGSTSMLQRKLKLGYNRAGRIMDQLEYFGIVGPSEGSKAREVYFDSETELMEHLEAVINS